MTSLVRHLYESLIPYETRGRFYKFRNPEHYKELRRVVHPSDKGDFSLKPFDENQCIFVHITKSAGTSVAKSLFNYLPYHYTAIDYRIIYGKETFDRYFKFAFVRNPWDRLYSAYRYLKAGGWNEKDQQWCDDNIAQFEDFNEFVEQWLTTENIKKHLHFKPQYEFICDTKQRLLINYLAYFETIEDDYAKIASQLKIDSSIGHHNANPAAGYQQIYNEQSRRIVAQVYETDIKMFGYAFNGIEKRTELQSL